MEVHHRVATGFRLQGYGGRVGSLRVVLVVQMPVELVAQADTFGLDRVEVGEYSNQEGVVVVASAGV